MACQAGAGGFNTPHKRYVGTGGRLKEDCRTQDGQGEGFFESTNLAELALVGSVSAGRPRPGHVDDPHAFKHKELDIARAREFAAKDLTDSARFTYKVGPIGDLREAEARLATSARSEWGPHRQAVRVVTGLTWAKTVEARAAKAALDNVLTQRQRSQTARA